MRATKSAESLDHQRSPVGFISKTGMASKQLFSVSAKVIEGSKIVGEFIAAHSAPVPLREGVLYMRVLQPASHYELEQVSKIDILRKLKKRFVAKTVRDVRLRWLTPVKVSLLKSS